MVVAFIFIFWACPQAAAQAPAVACYSASPSAPVLRTAPCGRALTPAHAPHPLSTQPKDNNYFGVMLSGGMREGG